MRVNWLLLLCGLLSFSPTEFAAAAERPLVLIPGVMGSKLCDGTGKVVWGDRSSYTYSRIAALRLPFDSTKHDSRIGSCGLIESVNIIPLFWESNVYTDLLKVLRGFGYSDSEIIKFDYDWRLSNFENADRLKDVIDKQLGDKGGKFDILAHSMGGIIARIYVQRLGGEDRVQNFIMLGTPHRGSASVFERLYNGFQNWPSRWSGGLPEIQRTILSFPSTYQLLPTYENCCAFGDSAHPETNRSAYVDILAPSTWARFSWLPSELQQGAGAEYLKAQLAEAKKLKALLAEPIFRSSNENSKIHFVANGFIDTWSRVYFDPNSGAITGSIKFPGDGTVLLWSATNENPSQVQISHKEHALVFAGQEPELVLKLALTGVVLHNFTDFSRKMKDAKGGDVVVEEASTTLEPRFAVPSATVAVKLALRGSEPLQQADLSHLVAELVRDNIVIDSKRFETSEVSGRARTLAYTFRAPAEPGPYTIRLRLPGIEDFETIFAVVDQ